MLIAGRHYGCGLQKLHNQSSPPNFGPVLDCHRIFIYLGRQLAAKASKRSAGLTG